MSSNVSFWLLGHLHADWTDFLVTEFVSPVVPAFVWNLDQVALLFIHIIKFLTTPCAAKVCIDFLSDETILKLLLQIGFFGIGVPLE